MTKYPEAWFKRAAGVALLVFVCLLPATSLFAQALGLVEDEPGGPVYVGGELLVQFKADATDEQLSDAVKKGALGLLKHIQTDVMKAEGRQGLSRMWTGLPVRQAIQALQNHPAVDFAEPNWVYTHQDGPNDPFFTGGQLWGMYSGSSTPANDYGSHAVDAWNATYTGSSGVYVGVIDEGMQYTHPDLSANVDYTDSRNFIDSPPSQNIYTAGQDAHGTHVAGTIGALGDNALGVVGVNWNVTIISAKFLGPNGGTTADAIEAIDYLTGLKTRAGNPLNIVALNNSWGGGGFSQALLDAIVRAAKANILFVAAAGNGNVFGWAINTDSSPNYPSCYDTTLGAGYDAVISVTAIDSAGNKASWANYGARTVDLGAPGVDIYSTLPTDTYGSYSGTSMATPHVTGAAALYASTHPSATALEIKNALLGSATATASLAGKTVTGGRLNLSSVIAPPIPPTIPPVPTELNATAGDSKVTLSWTASAGATSYSVKRRLAADTLYTLLSTGVTTTTYTDSTAVNGTTYYYVVSAANAAGESADSSPVSATPQLQPPAAPTGLTATAGDSKVTLSWTASVGATGYNVKRATMTGGPYTTLASPTTTAYIDNTAANGTKYYYVVTAVSAGGESGPSTEVSATPGAAPTVPAAPSNLAATAVSRSQINLAWTDNSDNETGFSIERSRDQSSWSQIATVGADAKTYSNMGLRSNTRYYYRVRAYNAAGSSGYSNIANARTFRY